MRHQKEKETHGLDAVFRWLRLVLLMLLALMIVLFWLLTRRIS
jgi:hypothetical protein